MKILVLTPSENFTGTVNPDGVTSNKITDGGEFIQFACEQEPVIEFNGTLLTSKSIKGLISVPKADWDALNITLSKGDDLSSKLGKPLELGIVEATKPFWNGQQPKINPRTDEVLLHNGQPIYRRLVVGAEGQVRSTKLATTSTIPLSEWESASEQVAQEADATQVEA